MTARVPLAVPAHALPQRSATDLLALARAGLSDAASGTDGIRYANAHLAALRAAAAVLAARATPTVGRGKVPSVWVLLVQLAPEMSDWVTFFVETSSKRAACEAGVPHVVSAAEADSMLRSATDFANAVEALLGSAVAR